MRIVRPGNRVLPEPEGTRASGAGGSPLSRTMERRSTKMDVKENRGDGVMKNVSIIVLAMCTVIYAGSVPFAQETSCAGLYSVADALYKQGKWSAYIRKRVSAREVAGHASQLLECDCGLGAHRGARFATGAICRTAYRHLSALRIEDGLGANVGTCTATRAVLFFDDGHEHLRRPSRE